MTEKSKTETRLDTLVDKLYAEGVGKAKAEAAKLVEQAEKEAEAIRAQAKKEAGTIVKEAKSQAESFQNNAIASLKQAARDVTLALNRGVRDLFMRAFKAETAATLDEPDFLRELIAMLAEKWADGNGVTVTLKPETAKKVLALAKSGSQEMLDEGVEIKSNRSLGSGFRIRRQGDEVAFDFTDESIVESLKAQLNPQLAELLES